MILTIVLLFFLLYLLLAAILFCEVKLLIYLVWCRASFRLATVRNMLHWIILQKFNSDLQFM